MLTSNTQRAAFLFGGLWLLAAIAFLVFMGLFVDQDAGFDWSVLSLRGFAASALAVAPFVLPSAFFAFFWLRVYRPPAA